MYSLIIVLQSLVSLYRHTEENCTEGRRLTPLINIVIRLFSMKRLLPTNLVLIPTVFVD